MKPGVFREEYIAIIVRELLRGLDYLHTEGKLHRDIKGNFQTKRDCFKSLVNPRYTCYSRQYPLDRFRRSQAGRLWCFRSADGYNDEKEYFRWHAILVSSILEEHCFQSHSSMLIVHLEGCRLKSLSSLDTILAPIFGLLVLQLSS